MYRLPNSPYYYLFRTQRYRNRPETRVYRSTDPLQVGIEDDSRLVALQPVVAPELGTSDGTHYIAALMPDLNGLCIARLEFAHP